LNEINHFTQSQLNLIGFIYLTEKTKLCSSFFLSGSFEVKQRNPGLKQRKFKVNSSIKWTFREWKINLERRYNQVTFTSWFFAKNLHLV